MAELVMAEALCAMTTGAVGRLDDIAADGRAMSVGLTQAVDGLDGFTVAFDWPLPRSPVVGPVGADPASADHQVAAADWDEQVAACAVAFGLSTEAAGVRLAEMRADVAALVAAGFGVDDAAAAVQYA